MTTPRTGDRIDRWLLSQGSRFATRIGRTETWDPEDLFGPEIALLGKDFDVTDALLRHIATYYADYLIDDTGRQASAAYEMIACLPTDDPDGQTTFRVLMRHTASTAE